MGLLNAGRKLKDDWGTWCGDEICGIEVVSDGTLAAAGAGGGGTHMFRSLSIAYAQSFSKAAQEAGSVGYSMTAMQQAPRSCMLGCSLACRDAYKGWHC